MFPIYIYRHQLPDWNIHIKTLIGCTRWQRHTYVFFTCYFASENK